MRLGGTVVDYCCVIKFLCLQFYPGGLTKPADRLRRRVLDGSSTGRCHLLGLSPGCSRADVGVAGYGHLDGLPGHLARARGSASSGPCSAYLGHRRARARRSGGLGRHGSAGVPRLPRPRRPHRSRRRHGGPRCTRVDRPGPVPDLAPRTPCGRVARRRRGRGRSPATLPRCRVHLVRGRALRAGGRGGAQRRLESRQRSPSSGADLSATPLLPPRHRRPRGARIPRPSRTRAAGGGRRLPVDRRSRPSGRLADVRCATRGAVGPGIPHRGGEYRSLGPSDTRLRRRRVRGPSNWSPAAHGVPSGGVAGTAQCRRAGARTRPHPPTLGQGPSVEPQSPRSRSAEPRSCRRPPLDPGEGRCRGRRRRPPRPGKVRARSTSRQHASARRLPRSPLYERAGSG